jgi:hypothetical protein
VEQAQSHATPGAGLYPTRPGKKSANGPTMDYANGRPTLVSPVRIPRTSFLNLLYKG